MTLYILAYTTTCMRILVYIVYHNMQPFLWSTQSVWKAWRLFHTCMHILVTTHIAAIAINTGIFINNESTLFSARGKNSCYIRVHWNCCWHWKSHSLQIMESLETLYALNANTLHGFTWAHIHALSRIRRKKIVNEMTVVSEYIPSRLCYTLLPLIVSVYVAHLVLHACLLLQYCLKLSFCYSTTRKVLIRLLYALDGEHAGGGLVAMLGLPEILM